MKEAIPTEKIVGIRTSSGSATENKPKTELKKHRVRHTNVADPVQLRHEAKYFIERYYTPWPSSVGRRTVSLSS